MKERPILMAGPMVRATLRDVDPKTVTRRIVKPQPVVVPGWATNGLGATTEVDGLRFAAGTPREATYAIDCVAAFGDDIAKRFSPYGVPGDRLWVRETWARLVAVSPATDEPIPIGDGERLIEPPTQWTDAAGRLRWSYDGVVIAYRANSDVEFCDGDGFSGDMADKADLPRWRPSVHMPRALSRIDLEIVSVRVERLQDITEEDARREGIAQVSPGVFDGDGPAMGPTAVHAFMRLWEALNGPGAWASNPWVWRVEFKRTKAGAS